ncbi:MAG: hypothetical protein R3B06_04815 [Kofleriaceae bacterium]
MQLRWLASLVTTLGALTTATGARADQPDAGPPGPLPASALQPALHAIMMRPPPPPPPSGKSPGLAVGLAVGTTFVGYAAVVGGAYIDNGAFVPLFFGGQAIAAVGPSAGHLYAGEVSHALLFGGIRAGALMVADLGVGLALGCAIGDSIDDSSSNGDCGSGATALMLGGLGVAAAFGLYDWLDAAPAARRANQRARDRAGLTAVSIIPTVDRTRGSTGLALTGAF